MRRRGNIIPSPVSKIVIFTKSGYRWYVRTKVGLILAKTFKIFLERVF